MRRITVGVLAHVDAGKTTLSEALLYRGGRLKKLRRPLMCRPLQAGFFRKFCDQISLRHALKEKIHIFAINSAQLLALPFL